MFDSVCKFLVETFPNDFASWLLGEPVELSELSPSELSNEPVRADALILLQSTAAVLHIEFQTRPVAEMAFRMLDYRVRVYRRFPEKEMRQVVVYLKPSQSNLVYQDSFDIPNTHHSYEVMRIWEQPVETLLSTPGLMPFATLGKTNAPAEALRQISAQVRNIPDPRLQRNLAGSAAALAGILLDETLIVRIMGQDILEESSFFQAAMARGRETGLQVGREEGRIEGREEGRIEGREEGRLKSLLERRSLILRQLNRKLGPLSEADMLDVSALSYDQLGDLGEALFDFENQSDLSDWLSLQKEHLSATVQQLSAKFGVLPEEARNRLQLLASAQLTELRTVLPELTDLAALTDWLDDAKPRPN